MSRIVGGPGGGGHGGGGHGGGGHGGGGHGGGGHGGGGHGGGGGHHGGGHHGGGHRGPGWWGPGGLGGGAWDYPVYVEGSDCLPNEVEPGGWVCDPSGHWHHVGSASVGGVSLPGVPENVYGVNTVKLTVASAVAALAGWLVFRKKGRRP